MRKIIYNSKDIEIDDCTYFGTGLFETILIQKKPIFLKEHIHRINWGISELGLGEKISLIEIEKFILDNNIENSALKIIVTKKNLIFIVRELTYTKDDYENGFIIRLSNIRKSSQSRIVRLKTINYLENILELKDAKKLGYNESIFFNENGILTEGCITNIFIIKNKCIYTPKISAGLLPGIIRGWVINNFEVNEIDITKDMLLEAEEIFLTNSLVGIIKVSELEGKRFNFIESEKIRNIYQCYINGGRLTDE